MKCESCGHTINPGDDYLHIEKIFCCNCRNVETASHPDQEKRIYHHKKSIIEAYRNMKDPIEIETSHGSVFANHGDWIIRNAQGDVYPCSDTTFRENYGDEQSGRSTRQAHQVQDYPKVPE